MKTVLPVFRRMCLFGSLLAAGCLSETEGPDAVSTADRNTERGEPVPAAVDEQIIRQVAVTEIIKTSPQKSSSEYHRVQPGETLSAIAARYRTTADRLAQANGLGDPDHLAVGEWLLVSKGRH